MNETAKEVIEESGKTIRYGLRYNPVPLLLLCCLIVFSSLFAYYLYLDDKHYKMNTELTNTTMSAQNKILLDNNELKKQEITKLDEIKSLLKKKK